MDSVQIPCKYSILVSVQKVGQD